MLYLFIIMFCNICNAGVIDRTIYNQKVITPRAVFKDDFVPEKFNQNNNLARSLGSYYFASGEPLIIEGIVTDINDIPIEGAIVTIWQANSFGYYQSKITDGESSKIDRNFMETGTFFTDSLGRYLFLTVVPGAIKTYPTHCPHVNVMVSKKGITTLFTKIFFSKIVPDDCDNSKDIKSLNINDEQRTIIEQDFYYIDSRDQSLGKRIVFNIKLDYIQQTKDF